MSGDVTSSPLDWEAGDLQPAGFNLSSTVSPACLNDTEDNCTSAAGPPVEQCRHPEYYSFNYVVVGTFFQSIIFVIGVLGNLLVCAVVYRTRSMHSTTNCYLVKIDARVAAALTSKPHAMQI